MIQLGSHDRFFKLVLRMQNFLILAIVKVILAYGSRRKHLFFWLTHSCTCTHTHKYAQTYINTHTQPSPTRESNKQYVIFM